MERGEASFQDLKALLGSTQGNLGAHLGKLEEGGYVAVTKHFVGKRPRGGVHDPRQSRVGSRFFPMQDFFVELFARAQTCDLDLNIMVGFMA